MAANLNTIILALAAAVANGIAASQSLGAAGNLTINGSLASGGVATMDVARRVIITSAGNDSALNWTITGTDRYGRTQSEVLAGGNAVAVQSVKDYLTVTNIAGSAATASTVTAGTSATGSSALIAIDYFANPPSISASISQTGTVTSQIEVTNSDPGPAWDFNGSQPVWYTATGFTGVTTQTGGQIAGPLTALRVTNTAGTGTSTTTVNQAFVAGGV